ncbi:MAG: hypothetical protein NHF92_00475 [Candidatus Shikimatogenerans bostrichidophilus]|nr:MAG: hypothetical protein NHF92_00475 [Candidatus Shikimatogenerans bostrichidophilus]
MKFLKIKNYIRIKLMILLYIKKYNKNINNKKYIYKNIKNINKILKIINNNFITINNYKKILLYFKNKFPSIQYEDKEIIKYIIYLKYKKKINFIFFKRNNINFFLILYKIIKIKKKKILNIIKNKTINWTIYTINPLIIILLLMAISEYYIIRKREKIYINILIYEYINIANIFTSLNSKIFINGILDKIFKTIKKI